MSVRRADPDTRPDPSVEPDADAFHIDVLPRRTAVRVVPVGDLDLTTVGAFTTQLHELREAGFDQIELDLRRLDLLDSASIRVIVAEHRLATVQGRVFSIVGGPPVLRRALDDAGALGELPVEAQQTASPL